MNLVPCLFLLYTIVFCFLVSSCITGLDVQIVLLLLAIVAVPWMLFPKPFILKKRHTEVPLLPALFDDFLARKFVLFNETSIDCGYFIQRNFDTYTSTFSFISIR